LTSHAGIAGVSRRKFVVTTVKGDGRQAPDLVERNFTAEAPDRPWVADITYIPTCAGSTCPPPSTSSRFQRRRTGYGFGDNPRNPTG
jgi:transposase InsO family protein